MDAKQYDELAVALALVQDREDYLKERLQAVAGDILAEQDRLRKQRQALIGSSSEPEGLIQFFGPYLHKQTGAKQFASGVLTIVTGSEVHYDEVDLVAHLAQQGRYGYLAIRRKQTEAMIRATLDYEPDLPASIQTGPKINGVSAVSIKKGFEVPTDAQYDEQAINALIERAATERKRVVSEAAAVQPDLLTQLEEQGEHFLDNDDVAE